MDVNTALYFPHINVPTTPWFNQVLLYWDRASTIVPDSMHLLDLELIDPHMRDLMESELLEVVSPDSGLYKVGHSTFSGGFLSLLGDERKRRLGRRKYTRLHVTKMSFSLFEELKRRGLARPTGSSTRDWWRVEETTAGLYMSYLAAVISAANPGVQPVTDSEINLVMSAGRGPNATERLAALRYRVIHEAIPAPQGTVRAADLRRFKDANRDSLRRCRQFVDGQLADLASMPEDEMAEVRLKALMQPIEDEVARLTERMQARRWPGVALVGFGGSIAATLGATAATLSAGSPLLMGLAAGAGALQLGAGGFATHEMICRPRFDSRAPLAYAALAARL